jgi:hypothetical protein
VCVSTEGQTEIMPEDNYTCPDLWHHMSYNGDSSSTVRQCELEVSNDSFATSNPALRLNRIE